jgi:hypothetical protein
VSTPSTPPSHPLRAFRLADSYNPPHHASARILARRGARRAGIGKERAGVPIHEDIGFLSHDKSVQKLVLRQFHVEGFVNQYVVDRMSDDGRTIVFVSTAIENIPAGWRARETFS